METLSEEIEEAIRQVLGKGGADLQFWQTMLRALIIYLIALLAVRLGKKRLLGRNTAFDVILGIILGSIFSRTIHSEVPFFGSIMAAGVLVFMHWIFAYLAFRMEGFGKLVKGGSNVLVNNGEIDWDAMKRNDMTQEDLKESMRLQMKSEDLSKIQTATLERNGNISFVTKESKPKIVEVEVKEGVQRIRIEIS